MENPSDFETRASKPARESRARLQPMLVGMAALMSLSMDVYLPSMGSIALDFGVPLGSVQHTVSAFLLSFGVGQLAFGPLSDRWGRRRPLLVALGLYGVANLLASLAPTLGWLLVARCLQGLAASATAVTFVAIARDVYRGPELGRVLGTTAAAAALAPMLAPSLGALLDRSLGWRSSFASLALLGITLCTWFARTLPETNTRVDREALRNLARQYAEVLVNPVWRRHGVVSAAVFTALFGFLGCASPILIQQYQMRPFSLSLCFAANAGVYMLSGISASHLVTRHSSEWTARRGSALVTIGGAVMLALSAIHSPLCLLGPMLLVTFGVGLTMPTTMATSLGPFSQRAGRASALLGFWRFSLGGLAGFGLASHANAPALAGVILLIGTLCLGLLTLRVRPLPGPAAAEAA